MHKNMHTIQIYAELLLHIRIVSLYVTLDTEHSASTIVSLAEDGETINVAHHNAKASLQVPTRIARGESRTIDLPSSPSKELTLRLQLNDAVQKTLPLQNMTENLVPWTASSINDTASVMCSHCDTVFVESQKLRGWQDLPNENWAELMEFWHCHKPSSFATGSHREIADSKGYGESSKLRALKDVALVDTISVLLRPESCVGIRVR